MESRRPNILRNFLRLYVRRMTFRWKNSRKQVMHFCPLAIGALWAMLWGCSPPTISPSRSRPIRSRPRTEECSALLVMRAPTCSNSRRSASGLITGSPRIGYSYTERVLRSAGSIPGRNLLPAGQFALHSVRGRLCRWLLQSQDMIGSATFTLT